MRDEKPNNAQIANPPARSGPRKRFPSEIDCRNEHREGDRLGEMLVEIEHVRNIVDIAARQQVDEQLIDEP
jgi:hypothetical protein